MKSNDCRRVRGLSATTFSLLMASALLVGCEGAQPKADDIKPYLQAEMDLCPVFNVTDVHVVDRMEREGASVVDFKAKISLKWSTEEVLDEARKDPKTSIPCQYFLGMLRALSEPRQLVPQYEVAGVGAFARSERGWRLLERLRLDFTPIATSTASSSSSVSSTDPQEIPPAGEKKASPVETLKPSAPVAEFADCASKDDPHEEIDCIGAVADTYEAAARQRLSAPEYTRYKETVAAGCDQVEEELMEMGVSSGTVIGRARLSCAAEGWAAVVERVKG